MTNNNMYALLIGVGDYEKMKIPNIPSYKMDVTLIGAGLVSGLKCAKEHVQVVAGEDDNGIVSTAALARGIESFKKVLSVDDTFIFYFSGHGSAENLVFSDGQVDQQSIINYIDSLRCKNKIVILDCCYSGKFKTLGANHLSMEQSVTKDVAESIKYANVFSDEKSVAMYAGFPAKAVWCYFCKDKKDVINHTYPYYTIWAADDVRNKYYRASANARILDDIYGKIQGAVKFGRDWAIPEDTEKPKDARVRSGEYRNWRKKQDEQ